MALSLGLIGASFLLFYVCFEQLLDFGREGRQFARQSLQLGPPEAARIARREGLVTPVKAFPVADILPVDRDRREANALLHAGLDHLDDVAPNQRDPFAQQRDRAVLGAHFFGEVFDLGRARDQRRQIEAEGAFDLAALPSSGEAFAVRRVAPDDQPRLDERREMPAQRRRRHAMGADRELPVRRKHDDAGRRRIILALRFWIAFGQRQRGFLMEAEQARAAPTAPGR